MSAAVLEDVDLERLLQGPPPQCCWGVAPGCLAPAAWSCACPMCGDFVLLCEAHGAQIRAGQRIHCERGDGSGLGCPFVGAGSDFVWRQL